MVAAPGEPRLGLGSGGQSTPWRGLASAAPSLGAREVPALERGVGVRGSPLLVWRDSRANLQGR